MKFTKVINYVYYMGMSAQYAKAAINDADYKDAQEQQAREWKTRDQEQDKKTQKALCNHMREILKEDDRWLNKVAAETRSKAKENFQHYLLESGGKKCPVLSNFVES